MKLLDPLTIVLGQFSVIQKVSCDLTHCTYVMLFGKCRFACMLMATLDRLVATMGVNTLLRSRQSTKRNVVRQGKRTSRLLG